MERPKVGLGIIVFKDGKLLMLRRKGAHGEGSWSVPGGHLEFNEGIEDGAKREVLEETGIKVGNIMFVAFTNDIFEDENKHYITIFVKADYTSGDLKINKDESTELGWFAPNALPQPLFLPFDNLLKNKCYPSNWGQSTGLGSWSKTIDVAKQRL